MDPQSRNARALRSKLAAEGVAVTEEHPRTVAATSFGAHCRIRTPIYLTHSSLGDWSYVEAHCRISHVLIGKFTAIAPGCHIGLAEHPATGTASIHPVFYRRDLARGFDFAPTDLRTETAPTVVGNDVWIGAGAIVKGGVTIGDGAIVGAGAVVTKDVSPYAIVAGVPSSVLRYRFEASDIEFLTAIEWWNWDTDTLREHYLAFQDIDELRRVANGLSAARTDATQQDRGPEPGERSKG